MPAAGPQRGEIWTTHRETETSTPGRVLVLQTDPANHNPRYGYTIVVPISPNGMPIPLHVRLAPSAMTGLKEGGFVRCERLLTLPKSRLLERAGRIGPVELKAVEEAIRLVLALP